MHAPVRTAAPPTTVAGALDTMRTHAIRHLPVVEVGGERLVGIVTDRDLRGATSTLAARPAGADTPIEGVMVRDVVTAAPLDPVEEAARTMRARRIGCLPVLDGDRLVGIVTAPDLLDALVRLTGTARPSGRLAVQIPPERGALAHLAGLIDARGVTIHSLLSYPDAEGGAVMILRVDTTNTAELAEALRTAGIEVLWPLSHR